MTTVLIDGDEVAYKAAFATETSVRWNEETWVSFADETEMKDSIDTIVSNALEDTKCDKVFVALSDRENFRKRIYPEYKANRKNNRKPVGLKFCRDYLFNNYKTRIRRWCEADDTLAIEAYKNIDNTVIWSVDKDFLTVPCNLFREGKIQKITKEEAEAQLKYQTLIGDTADNFGGAKSFGPVKASKWLNEKGYSWHSVVKAFESVGMTQNDCTLNARLARILWTPKEKMKWRPDYEMVG